jgi:hypothetical protein
MSIEEISKKLIQLRTLDVSFTENMTDAGVGYIATLPQLQNLNLDGCTRITNACLDFLASGLANLQHLEMSYCYKLTKVRDYPQLVQCMKYKNIKVQ